MGNLGPRPVLEAGPFLALHASSSAPPIRMAFPLCSTPSRVAESFLWRLAVSGVSGIANDYNPVAHLILRSTCDYPQQYGRPGSAHLTATKGSSLFDKAPVPNVLIADLQTFAQQVLGRVEQKLKHLYPPGSDGLPILIYLWARTVPCSNPSCRAVIPLIRSFVLRTDRPKSRCGCTCTTRRNA